MIVAGMFREGDPALEAGYVRNAVEGARRHGGPPESTRRGNATPRTRSTTSTGHAEDLVDRPLSTVTTEDQDPDVNGDRQWHKPNAYA